MKDVEFVGDGESQLWHITELVLAINLPKRYQGQTLCSPENILGVEPMRVRSKDSYQKDLLLAVFMQHTVKKYANAIGLFGHKIAKAQRV